MATSASGYYIVKFWAFLSSHVQWIATFPVSSSIKTPTVVVTEGIPPVACRLVEKIRKWEYVNLGDLLKDHSQPEQLVVVNGQIMPLQSGQKQSSRTITDILFWLQAYSVFSAILLSCEDTSTEEAAGLAADSYLILQMSKDLQGPQWLTYNQSFREWAAAKNIRKWGGAQLYNLWPLLGHPTAPSTSSSSQAKEEG